MNSMLNTQTVLDATAETDIPPVFIEKDWYACQLLGRLTAFTASQGIEIVFSGGTSLSKGHNLIKRFSEDLDFILCSDENISRGNRRSFRKNIIAHIVGDNRFTIDDGSIYSGRKYRFFRAPVDYKRDFEADFIRPYLQVEMTFSTLKLPPIQCDIRSIIAELSGGEAEANITCISPIETAADKISALSWRVVVRDSDKGDPTLIRHLHDLAALKNKIFAEKETFITCAKQSLEHDQKNRGGATIANMTVANILEKSYNLLANQKIYHREYQQFVETMSYATAKEQISFDDALASLKDIMGIIS